ncbi:MAG: methylglyoxal synthase [Peptococcaceae bacterium]|nr:methylglyoxal synthase [Peptococcaceae bacterium]
MKSHMIKLKLEKTKCIALIAHDGKKPELIEWAKKNKETLSKHFLYGTGTTGTLITEHTGLPVKTYNSGPLGGDQQIGARIVEGEIDFVIFLWDPLAAQPHDPDVKALLRISAVYNIPIASNLATADFIINSSLMNEEYEYEIKDYQKDPD